MKAKNPWTTKTVYLAVADDNYPLALYSSREAAEQDRPGCRVHELFLPRPAHERWYEDAHITSYCDKHYTTTDGLANCVLCGCTGVIDTRGVRTPAGQQAGRRSWCMCPNGQIKRATFGNTGPI